MNSTTDKDPRLTDEFVTSWVKDLQLKLDRLASSKRAGFNDMPWTITFTTRPANIAIDPSRFVFYKQLPVFNKQATIIYRVDNHAGFGIIRAFQSGDAICDPVDDLEAFVRMIMEDAVSNGHGKDLFSDGNSSLDFIDRQLEWLIRPVNI